MEFSGAHFFPQNYYLAAIPDGLYSRCRYQPPHKEIAKKLQIMPRQEIAVLRHGTSTIRKKKKEFCLMSHFDPRIMRCTPEVRQFESVT
ncbi:MAG: hypothetical protein WA672_01260, partial [Candidatus Angelobacter sp.]